MAKLQNKKVNFDLARYRLRLCSLLFKTKAWSVFYIRLLAKKFEIKIQYE
jgi:hypothetical protein